MVKDLIIDLSKGATILPETNDLSSLLGESGITSSVPAIVEKRSEAIISVQDYEKEMGTLMFCNNCIINDRCPKKVDNSTCAFSFKSTTAESTHPIAVVDSLIALQQERVLRAMMIEKMEGGSPNRIYTQELRVLEDLANAKANLLIQANTKRLQIDSSTVITEQGTGGGGGFLDVLKAALSK